MHSKVEILPVASVQMFEAADLPARFLWYVWITAVMVLRWSGLHCLLFSLTPANHLKQGSEVTTGLFLPVQPGHMRTDCREVKWCLCETLSLLTHWALQTFILPVTLKLRSLFPPDLRKHKKLPPTEESSYQAAAITHDENRAVFNATASHAQTKRRQKSKVQGPLGACSSGALRDQLWCVC